MALNGYKSSYFASCEKLGRTLRWFTGAIWMLSRSGDKGVDGRWRNVARRRLC